MATDKEINFKISRNITREVERARASGIRDNTASYHKYLQGGLLVDDSEQPGRNGIYVRRGEMDTQLRLYGPKYFFGLPTLDRIGNFFEVHGFTPVNDVTAKMRAPEEVYEELVAISSRRQTSVPLLATELFRVGYVLKRASNDPKLTVWTRDEGGSVIKIAPSDGQENPASK